MVPLAGAIKSRMKGEAIGQRRGWKAAVEQGQGIRDELLRIVKETMPPGEREPMMRRISAAQTLGDLNQGVRKLRDVLADYEVKRASTQLEKLTGKQKVDMPGRDSTAPELTEAEAAEAAGKRMVEQINRKATREVDLARIDPAYRDRFKPLLDRAKVVQSAMKGAKDIDTKYAAIGESKKLFDEIPRPDRAARHGAARADRHGQGDRRGEAPADRQATRIAPAGERGGGENRITRPRPNVAAPLGGSACRNPRIAHPRHGRPIHARRSRWRTHPARHPPRHERARR
jgi:hypothetical protein